MITKASIRAIKTAQRAAGMDDAGYRAMLRREFDAGSCKDLAQGDVGRCLELLSPPRRAAGWQPRQIGTLRRYAKLAGWTVAQMRAEVRQVTGAWREDSDSLDQGQFDRMMAVAEEAVEGHLAATGGSLPKGMRPRHWRDRNQGANTRLRKRLRDLWEQLCRLLPPDSRTDAYLCGIISKATGYPCRSPYGLQAWQANPAIEALKNRIAAASEAEGKTVDTA